MSQVKRLTDEERTQIEALIRAFDDHGCSQGLDLRAQIALRHLLVALDEAENVIEVVTVQLDELRERVWLVE